ncbi:barstar family protein [Streptomyces sp. NPDC058157]|uniref:barstar family protein n=1 Tax=Streptomyces sp. NPDC058157 TaxID=3346360 RepID=UPI0036EBB6EE
MRIAPWMHIVTPGGGVRLDELLPVSGTVHVVRLDGQDMPDEISAFREFDEALRFPEYFGWNWDALYDCLRDLRWLSADAHVLIIESAESALADDEVARDEFFRTLWRAGRRWSYTQRPEGATLSRLSVVLSCGTESADSLATRLGEIQGSSDR